MNKTIQRVASVIVAALLVTTTTACTPPTFLTSASPEPSSAKTSSFDQSASSRVLGEPLIKPAKATFYTDVDGATAEDLEAYLTSPERSNRYSVPVAVAGAYLAQALESGNLGQYALLTEEYQPVSPGYSGWGTITAIPNLVSAVIRADVRVWFSGGVIDYTKTITSLTIGDGAYSDASLSILGPSESSGTWTSYNDDGKTNWTNAYAYSTIKLVGWSNLNKGNNGFVVLPTSLQEFKDYDEYVLWTLQTSMTEWFGEDWAG